MPKSTQVAEVIIVGDDFTPGAYANAEIDSLIGFSTILVDDQAIRSCEDGCITAPDYCGDYEVVKRELDKLDLDPLILPSFDTKNLQRGIVTLPKYTATFMYNSEYHVTTPLETEELALACALWYVLAYH